MKYYIHPHIKKRLEHMASSPPHAILFHGKKGVGLKTIAEEYIKKAFPKSQTIEIKADEKGLIKIDQIRELYNQTRAKQIKQLILFVDDADGMQVPAQNALLKLLEEPPIQVFFVLTSHAPDQLLSTIRSRLQELMILPITSDQTKEQLADLGIKDVKKHSQIYFLATGLPAEIIRLVHDNEYFLLRSEELRRARDFIAENTYQKLVIVYGLGSDRDKGLQLVRDGAHIIENSLLAHPSQNLATVLEKLLKAEEKLLQDGHIRSQLLKIVI